MVFPYTLRTVNKIMAKFYMKQRCLTLVGTGYYALLAY